MAYERVNWENLPSTKTPVNADNLNKMDEGIANAVEKTGDTMTGGLFMQGNSVKFGNNGNVLWKEDGYGDKFRIIPNFNGAGADNKLIIQSTTGEAGTDPQNWKDLVTIHADSGQVDLIHPNEVYSTTEQVIGTWIDGKPIYRKVSNATLQNESKWTSLINIPNLDKLINAYGFCNNVTLPRYESPNYYVQFLFEYDYLKYMANGISDSATIVTEYTKTTDA